MTVTGLEDTSRQFKLIEEDSGIGWAVAFILLAIALGIGIIMFLDRQPKLEYRMEKAIQEMYDCPLLRDQSYEIGRHRTISDASVVDLDEPVNLSKHSDFPIRAASGKRFSHVQ
jgi:hypothetical protein